MKKRLKVGLSCRHGGLTRLLLDMWMPDFDVRMQSHYHGISDRKGVSIWKGDEDVYVSTIHHPDLLNEVEFAAANARNEVWNYQPGSNVSKPFYDGSRPVIAYLTDPLMQEVLLKLNGEWSKLPWLYRVGCEDCYTLDHFTHVDEWIPFALNPLRYHMYRGHVDKALIVQRHPLDRLRAIAPNFGEAPPRDLDDLMKNIPYLHPKEPNFHKFVVNYSECRVLFYWSDSPYTIVLFEAMTSGMPIVAMRTPAPGPVDPLRKYLSADHIFTNFDEAREKIRQYLREPAPERIEYPLFSFEEIRQKWADLFNRLAG